MPKKERNDRKPVEPDRKNRSVDKMAIDLLWIKNETLNPETGKEWSNSELAEMFQIHPQTVSRKISLARDAGWDYREGMISFLSKVSQKNAAPPTKEQIIEKSMQQVPPPQQNQAPVVTQSYPSQPNGMNLVPTSPLPVPTQNPLDFIKDFTQLAQTTVAAGSIPGSALVCIGAAFDQQSTLSREERYGMLAKGVLSISGLLFGMYETVNELNKRKINNQDSIDITPR